LKVPTRLVLHVLPIDLFRGAQTYARDLRMRLDDDDTRHRTLTLFYAPEGALQPDESLGVRSGLLRRTGIDPRALSALRRSVRAQRPDIVVAHGGEPLKYAALAGVDPRRLVYYKIGIEHGRLTGGRRRLHQWILGRAGAVAAVSEGAASEARALGVPAERVRVIPNGRDPSAYAPHAAHAGPPRLVWIGHFDASKRPERFVDLVRELRQRGVAVGASMAGEGALLEPLRSAAGLAGVELLGTVDDVPALLATSDLLVFTGAPPEGMPGVLIEAGLASLPVVTTAVPGADDVIEHGATGCVVPVDDFDGLVDATQTLLDDADRRARFAVAARERCAAKFSLDASAAKWRALFDEILSCTSST
jgi:glycosyltransferase involved in cell wall biosynthesis